MTSVLITGASSGIGEAFARQYASRGADLVLVARSKEKLDALSRELSRTHAISVTVLKQDLSHPDSAEKLVSSCQSQCIEIDVLVNNAGFWMVGPFSNEPLDELERMVVLHNLSLVKLTSLLLPGMKKRKRGGILNVSSITAFQGVPFNAVYAATKAFILSFSEALREELRGSGVNVCAVCPGLTRTKIFDITGVNPDKILLPVGLPEPVVKKAITGLEQNRAFVVPGLYNKILIHGGRVLPRSVMVRLGALLARNEMTEKQRYRACCSAGETNSKDKQ